MERTTFFSLLPYNYREPKCLYVTWRVFIMFFKKEMKMKMCGKQGLLRASGGLLMGCSVLISSREYQEPRSMTADHLSSIQSNKPVDRQRMFGFGWWRIELLPESCWRFTQDWLLFGRHFRMKWWKKSCFKAAAASFFFFLKHDDMQNYATIKANGEIQMFYDISWYFI